MRMKLLKVTIGVFIILILTLSCADKQKTLTEETDTIAGIINTELSAVRSDGEQLVNEAKKLLAMRDTFNEPIDDLDKSNGGTFEFINGYYTDSSSMVNDAKNLMKMPDDNKIRELKLMLKLLTSMGTVYNSRGFYDAIFYLNYTDGINMNINYPEANTVSSLPPFDKLLTMLGGSTRNLPYFAFVTKKNNPGKKGLWMNDLWINVGAGGVNQEFAIPVYINESDADCYAVFTLPVKINKFNEQYILRNEGLYIAINSMENVWGASQVAIDTLGIQLPFWDYLTSAGIKQLGDTFKLKSYDDPGLKQLGEKLLANEDNFEVTIKGIKYIVAVSEIPEVNSKLVGLVKK